MITLNFYSLTEDSRKISKTPTPAVVGPGAATSLSGTFKDPVDTFEPRVVVELGDSYIHAFNYVQIYEWAKYYFVVDKEILQKGLVRLYLREDVLGTFATEILALNAYVERTESNYKPFLVDSRRPMSAKIEHDLIENSNDSTILDPTGIAATDRSFVITMATPPGLPGDTPPTSSDLDVYPSYGALGADVGQLSWAVSKQDLISIFTDFYSQTFNEIVDKLIYNTSSEGIVNIVSFPFNINWSEALQPTMTNVKMFGHDFPIHAPRLLGTAAMTITFGPYEYKPTPSNYLDLEPYTSAQLYIPYVGMVDVPMRLMADGGVVVKYHVSLWNGDAIVYIAPSGMGTVPTDYYVRTIHAKLGAKVPISRTNALEQARNYLTAATKAAGGVAEVIGGDLKGLATIGSSMLSMAVNPMTMASSEFNPDMMRTLRYTPYALITKQPDLTPTNYGHFVGYPYQATTLLSGLSGFAVIGEVFGALTNATGREQDEAWKLLKSGVLF